MKKVISVLLAVLMFMSLSSAALSVAAADITDIPTIYIEGKGNVTIYNKDGSLAKNPKAIDREGYITEAMGPIFEELAVALVTDDYSDYIDSLIDAVAPIYEEYIPDSNGTNETSGSYIGWDAKTAPVSKKSSNYGIKDYVFKYDWRLSPMDVAKELDTYIERVCEATGHEKVNIFARCLGTNFALAYVQQSYSGEYDHAFRVQNLFLDTPTNAGLIAVGALLSGSIEFDADTIDRFVTYYLNDNDMFDDPALEAFAICLVSVMNHAQVLGLGVDVVADIYNKIDDELLPKLALCCYGAYTSYWSMVSDKYYDKAIAAIFNTAELKEEYAGFIKRTDAYHEVLGDVNEATGLAGYEQLILDIKEVHGVNTAVHAKYGSVTVPLFEGSDITGDTRGTVTELSLGAVGLKVGTTFSEDYLNKAEANGTAKWISPDKTVDASTALIPEKTWFTKNIAHDSFRDEYHDLAMRFFRSNGTLTVDTETTLAQYMAVTSDNQLVAVEGEDDREDQWTDNPFAVFIRFFTSLFNWLKNLFS